MVTLRNEELDFKPRIAPNARVAESSAPASIEIGEPRRFGLWSVAVIYAYGFLLAVPVLICVAGMTLIPANAWSLALPFVGLAFSALILPVGQGNFYITRLVQSWAGPANRSAHRYVVQLTLSPRVHGGLRGMLETADDVGLLTVGTERLEFHGDCIRLTAGYDQVEWIRPESIGWRGLFVYGQPVAFRLSTPRAEYRCQVAERSSWWLPGSHSVMRSMRKALRERLDAAAHQFD